MIWPPVSDGVHDGGFGVTADWVRRAAEPGPPVTVIVSLSVPTLTCKEIVVPPAFNCMRLRVDAKPGARTDSM